MARPWTLNTVEVAMKHARIATIGAQKDQRVRKRYKPGLNGRFE